MSTTTTTIEGFLRDRISEREENARRAEADPWRVGHLQQCDWWGDRPGYCTCGAIAREVAECEAKRRIVESTQRAQVSIERRLAPTTDAIDGHVIALREVVRVLASVYADHPDYRPEWKP